MTMPDVKKLTQKDYEYLIDGIRASNTRITELEAELEKATIKITNKTDPNEPYTRPIKDWWWLEEKLREKRKVITRLEAEVERLRASLAMIAARPLGGVLEDYICAKQLQEIAKNALDGEKP